MNTWKELIEEEMYKRGEKFSNAIYVFLPEKVLHLDVRRYEYMFHLNEYFPIVYTKKYVYFLVVNDYSPIGYGIEGILRNPPEPLKARKSVEFEVVEKTLLQQLSEFYKK